MKKPRLTDAERCLIEAGLRARKTPYAIAKELNRPIKTILREIKARAVVSEKGAAYRLKNRCIHSMDCTKRLVCGGCIRPERKLCRLCSLCNSHCPDFVENVCGNLAKPPFVCNGCKDEQKCVLRKRYYIASSAHRNYRDILVESRKGANITENEVLQLDKLIYGFTQNGQSIHAAMVAHGDEVCVSEKTVYRYVNGGLLTTIRGDLPRACRLKPRKAKSVERRVDTQCRIGRTYEDYQAFMAENPGSPIVEMDTVEGVKGGKVLLTLIFLPSRFMVARLLDAKTSANVTAEFRRIRGRIAAKAGNDVKLETFIRLFPVILTDNGTEFSNPREIEFDEEGNRLTKMFYCDSCASYQKAFVERNHEFIRMVLPKGTDYFEPTSFDTLTQEQIDLLMSNINSYPREILKDKTPYTLFIETFGEEIARDIFNIRAIKPDEVVLKPRLLGIEQKVRERILKA